ncbi:WD40-repeat-containing domain protein [Gaertneriomyces semiglobifer]|nr:WD40-repeat-containing domain protein [Gaertneriomyces semiglobifer]
MPPSLLDRLRLSSKFRRKHTGRADSVPAVNLNESDWSTASCSTYVSAGTTSAASLEDGCSFLPGLPSHVATAILAYLPVRDLVMVSAVSRAWRQLSLKASLWQALCLDQQLECGPGIEHLLEQCANDHNRWWKEVYVDAMIRQKNWQAGTFNLLSVAMVDIRDSINVFQFDRDRIILGTRRHKLSSYNVSSPTAWAALATKKDTHPVNPDVSFNSGHVVSITSLDFAGKNGAVCHTLASGDSSGHLILWNLFTGRKIASVHAHEGGVSSVLLLDDGKKVVSTGFDRKVRVFELRDIVYQDAKDTASPRVSQSELSSRHVSGLVKSVLMRSSALSQSNHSLDQRRISKTAEAAESNDVIPNHSKGNSSPRGEVRRKSAAGTFRASFGSTGSVRTSVSHRSSFRGSLHRKTSSGPCSPMSSRPPSKKKGLAKRLAIRVMSTGDVSSIPPAPLRYRLRARLKKLRKKHPAVVVKNSGDSTRERAVASKTLVCTRTMKGHTGDIYCMAAVDGGRMIVTGSLDHSVKLWSIQNLKLVRTMIGHTDSVTCVCARQDWLFSGSLDKSVRQWDIQTGRCLRTFTGHTNWVKTMDINDKWLITGGWDENVIVWDYHVGTMLHTLSLNSGPVTCLQFDTRKIVAACRGDGYQHHIVVMDFGPKRCG